MESRLRISIPWECFQFFNGIDPFTVDRTGDSNGVFETMRREILNFRIFWLSLHFARFLCINVLEPDENLTGPI